MEYYKDKPETYPLLKQNIKGYFDNIDHTHLLNMLALRIDDKNQKKSLTVKNGFLLVKKIK